MILVRRSYVIAIFSVIILSLFAASLKILILDWRAGHTTLYVINPRINWVGYHVEQIYQQALHYFDSAEPKGLDQVRLYIPEKANNALSERLPDSGKQWQRALMLYPDQSLQRIKVKYRGDNPFNWMFAKKSWRVKTRKKKLLEGKRVRNYVVPQSTNFLSQHLAMWTAKNAGVLAPSSNLVELFINDKTQGVMNEFEHLNEGFLRRTGFMPVNLYKGEQYYGERAFRVDYDLFNNPALWTKSAINNQFAEDNNSDLAFALDLIRDAETSEQAFTKLRLLAPTEEWARFAAYQVLIQSLHNDSIHNMRLVFDSWRGEIFPIAYDVSIEQDGQSPIFLDAGSHTLLRLLHRDSSFLIAKYRALYRMVVKERLLTRLTEEMDRLEPAMKTSIGRDMNLAQNMYYWGADRRIADSTGAAEFRLQLREEVENRERELVSHLVGPPQLSWSSHRGKFAITIAGFIPAATLSLQLGGSADAITRIAWDRDRDGRLSAGDLLLPFERKGNEVQIDAVWLASRAMRSAKSGTADAFSMSFLQRPTRFEIVSDSDLNVVAAKASNALTQKTFNLPRSASSGASPDRWNYPVIQNVAIPVETWRGNIEVKVDRHIDHPVRIDAGTRIKLHPGASLVFRNKLTVEGTLENPVVVTGAVPQKPWGTFALLGERTKGSRISHMNISGGSGDHIEQVLYTGMFSIHDTDDVSVRNMTLRDNHKFDDMMHIVYGRNIRLGNLTFLNAVSDALDIDISDVNVTGLQIVGSNNDAIDLMASTAFITNSTLRNSGDKGISVGEGSNALIFNTRLENNMIGVESKDASKAQILNSDFVNNRIQINAYRKNWRYDGGGKVDVRRAVFNGPANTMKAEKKSTIMVCDSVVSPAAKAGKRVAMTHVITSVDQIATPPVACPQSPLLSYEPLTANDLPKIRGVMN
jgi:hypothetical protein